MRRESARLIICALSLLAGAQVHTAEDARARTCLVLGGGGARGAAHIGILKVLERERIPVDCIVGTSMGSIVGGLYASGYSADEIEAAMQGIDWKDVFHDDPPRADFSMRRKDDNLHFLGGVELGLRDGKLRLPQGVVQGQKLLLALRRLLLPSWEVHDFDDLPIPYRAVAVNIVNGQKVVFGEGDLALAIRASMSVPGYFAPIRVDGQLLVDGGVLDNVPVDEARKLGAERLIVVAVGSPLHAEESLGSPLAVAEQVISLLTHERTAGQIASLSSEDVFIRPALGNFSAADFEHFPTPIGIGLAAAEAAVPELRRFAVSESDYRQFQARHRKLPFDAPLVQFLEVRKEQTRTARYLEHRMQGLVGERLEVADVEKEVAQAYGGGGYEYIRWDLERREGNAGLVLEPGDKQWGPNYLRMGMRLWDDLDGRSGYQLLSEMRLTGLNEHGGEALLRVDVGHITDVLAEFYQPFGESGRLAFAPYAEYWAYPLTFPINENVDAMEFRRSEYRGGLALSYSPDNRWRVTGSYERGVSEARLRVGLPLFADPEEDVGLMSLRLEYDTLDRVGFPSSGARFDFAQEEHRPWMGADDTAHVTRLTWDKVVPFGRNRAVFGLRGVYADGGSVLTGAVGFLGGLTNLSGLPEFSEIEPYTLLGRVIFYRQLGQRYYLGGSLEQGGAWTLRDQIDTASTLTAGSLFVGLRSFMGPVFLGYGRAEGGSDSFYLRLGPLLQAGRDY